jgi:serine/threonine-protein kinase
LLAQGTVALFFLGPPKEWQTLRPGEVSSPSGSPRRGRTARLAPRIVGRVLGGRFFVLGVTGSTGLGALYDAVELSTRSRVVVQVYDVPFEGDDAELARRAAPLLAARHAHVVTTHFVGRDRRGRPIVVSDRVEGESLRARLDDVQRLDLVEVVEVARQLLEGLGALHARGLVHGNLKPENVLFTTRRRARPEIRVVGHGATALLAKPGGVGSALGTPPYLAPEQFEGADLDARVDVWAAALVLYEMLAGERAYDGATIDDVARAITLGPPPTPSARRQAAAWADAPLLRALAQKREARYGSIAELAGGLEAAWARAPASQVLPKLVDPADLAERTTDLDVHVEITAPE